jgi:type I restriction enzyme M protein
VVANVFAGVTNRMINGYLLRDVIDIADEIHFDSSEEVQTLGHLYESLLREMRDAAGDSGEFYTPRAVVRFMVNVVDPKLGETVLDPAAGTGGFLVEAFTHLEDQAQSVEDYERLQGSLFGGEPKPLPYLLCLMNLLLHGVESPAIDPLNSLRFPLREIGDRDRVDVILTNPPFGGEEERSIRSNFPADLQTSETALLFLQLIMRKLRRRPKPGRAAVVVPNTTLFYGGVAAKIRRILVEEFNLYALVRLPMGVFEPYTDIETNLLFFDTTGASEKILYHRLEPPEGRKKYTKTQPLRAEDLAECLQLIQQRTAESPNAWFVVASDVLADENCTLDLHNPKEVRESGERPRVVVEKLEAVLTESSSRLSDAVSLVARLEELLSQRQEWTEISLRDALKRRREVVEIESGDIYKRLRIQVKGRGVLLRDEVDGAEIGTKRQFRVKAGQFVLSKIDARNGAFGIVPEECDGAVITGNFWAFDVDERTLRPRLLHLLTRSDAFIDFCRRASPGATNRRYLQEEKFLDQVAIVPPDPAVQDELCDVLEGLATVARFGENALPLIGKQFPFVLQSSLDQVFSIEGGGE